MLRRLALHDFIFLFEQTINIIESFALALAKSIYYDPPSQPPGKTQCTAFSMRVNVVLSTPVDSDYLDHYTFLGNCPPTPPLSQHFVLSEK